MMNVLIFTEGGRKTGFGHIMRCISLYDEVERRGIEVELIIHSDDKLGEMIGNRRHQLMNWYSIECLTQLIQSFSYCIVDSYIASENLYQVIQKFSKTALFLDDTQRITYPEGIVVHPSLLANDAPINSLAGPEYIILRDTFRKNEPKLIRPTVTNVLITLGGTSQPSLIQALVHSICSTFQEMTFHIVNGHLTDFSLKQESDLPANIVLHSYVSSDEMKQLMTDSDLVITAAGQTIYELLALGIPFIPIQIVNNQKRNMQALIQKELINTTLIWESSTFAERITQEFLRMLTSDAREQQIEKQNGIVDGKGPKRIIDALFQHREEVVFLREATPEDSLQVLDLSNQRHVRQYSIHRDPILWDTHRIWYNKVLSSPMYYFLIVTDQSNQVLGQIRYERTAKVAVISISLSNVLIGKKVSRSLIQKSLEMVRQEWKDVQQIIAYISNENVASKRTFERVGFKLDVSNLNNQELLTYIYKIGER